MIHLFCALQSEADPLLQAFKLTHCKLSTLFTTYNNDSTGITLTITGVGKIAAAAATMSTIDVFHVQKSDIFLNIGIAGHKTANIGDLILANRIEDKASNQSWYPQIIVDTDIPSLGLLTLDKPSTDYSNFMYDMEASGFYATVSRVGTVELCHVLKIISDNEQSHDERPSDSFVSGLIAARTDTINNFIESLLPYSSEYEAMLGIPDYYDAIVQRWHFSTYQRGLLQRLLTRWCVLLPEVDPLHFDFEQSYSGDQVLHLLQQQLNSVPFHLDDD